MLAMWLAIASERASVVCTLHNNNEIACLPTKVKGLSRYIIMCVRVSVRPSVRVVGHRCHGDLVTSYIPLPILYRRY